MDKNKEEKIHYIDCKGNEIVLKIKIKNAK